MRLSRDGENGRKWVWSWGKREIIYLSLHCHHQNDSFIKMGSDESHFNVSVGSDGQRHRTVSTDHNFWREMRAEAYRTEVPPRTSLTPYRYAKPAHWLKTDAIQWHIYPTFQANSETQVCTGIRQNQYLFKAGSSPFISKLAQHINRQIHTVIW